MAGGLYSTYSTGDNRVTATILAVLQRLSLNRLERILGAIMGQPEFSIIAFQNQPSRGAPGIPDAEIISSCRLLVETKTERKGVRADQLHRHLARLDGSKETTRCLLLLTPDDRIPDAVSDIADDLNDAIDELLADKQEVISERETLLLRELQIMFRQERLLEAAKDTVVVAARVAWPEYQKYGAYIYQAGRSFERVRYVAFYAGGEIQALVPNIEGEPQEVTFERGRYTGRIGKLVEQVLADEARDKGSVHTVLLLSRADSADTIRLGGTIQNDQKSANGKPTAFTMGQRYINLSDLCRVAGLPVNERQTSKMS